MRLGRLTAALAALVIATGCGAKAPDYQSVIGSEPTTTPTAPPVPIADYLKQQGVDGIPMTPQTLTELTVSIPQPPGWAVVNDPVLVTAFQVLRKSDVATYQPIATLYVFKLTGDFNVEEAIKHGYADAELSDRFKRLDASMADFNGMPSAMIEASYNLNDQRVHAYNRIVIATGPAPNNQRYLVQFNVSTAADEAEAHGADVLTIIKGFTVKVNSPAG